MTIINTARSRVGRAAFIALLMSSAATAALAAPSARDAQLQTMQRQLDEMRAQMEQMRAANAQDARLSAIQQQLEAFGQQLQEMKAAQTTAASDIATLKSPTGSAVTAKLSNGRPTFATADGNFSAGLKAVVMFDVGAYMQDDNLPASVTARDLASGSNFRRARFGVDGTIFKDFYYSLLYEFGGSGVEESGRIQEAFFQYNGLKPFRFRLGAFEPNVGLAAASSTSGIPLMERPAVAEIARNVAAGDARSALQVSANGSFGEGDAGVSTRWFASGALTGNAVGVSSPGGEQQALVGRVAIAPSLSNGFTAHLGANAQYVFQPGDAGAAVTPRYPIQLRDRPELRLDGTRLVDTSAIDADSISVYGLEAAGAFRNFLVEGEYFKFDLDRRRTGATALADPEFDGWYVQGSWVLTGETRNYNAADARFDAPKPAFNFNPRAGAWGAFEVAARYSTVDLNFREGVRGAATPAGGVRGGEQNITTVGLNWYLNPTLRMMLNYQWVDVERLTGAGAELSQDYNAVAARAQLSF